MVKLLEFAIWVIAIEWYIITLCSLDHDLGPLVMSARLEKCTSKATTCIESRAMVLLSLSELIGIIRAISLNCKSLVRSHAWGLKCVDLT